MAADESQIELNDEHADNYPTDPSFGGGFRAAIKDGPTQWPMVFIKDQLKAQARVANQQRRRSLAATLLQGYEAASHEKWPDVAKSALAAAGIIYPEETE